jgi:hypothetical protein
MRDEGTLPAQLIEATRRAVIGSAGVGILASLAIVVVAGIVAPGDAPGPWTWLRVLAIWLLVAIALGTIAEFGTGGRTANRTSPLIVWGALLVAVLISLSFNVLTTALTVLGLILLLLTVPAAGHALTFWTTIVTVTPLWVWSAFDAWDRWLLMLVPIAAIGLVSLEHAVRAGHAGGDQPQTMAAWVGLLTLAAATLVVALAGPIDPSWVTLAALAVALIAIVDVAVSRIPSSRLSPVVLPAIALVVIAFGWLAAL